MSEKTLDEMSTDEIVSWACGSILIAIGEGKFRSAVSMVVMAVTQSAYNRGVKAGQESTKKK